MRRGFLRKMTELLAGRAAFHGKNSGGTTGSEGRGMGIRYAFFARRMAGALAIAAGMGTILFACDVAPEAERATAPAAEPTAVPSVFDAALRSRAPGRVVKVHLVAEDREVWIADGVRMRAWTFNGSVPGPILRARVGDTVEVTFENRGRMNHSVDFHAARADWKTAFRSIAPGESHSFTFRPRYPGAFLYHCGTAPVLLHMGAGMYGVLIVDPAEPLPPAREFVLLHSEFYVGSKGKVRSPDYQKMLSAQPAYSAFNGRAFQYRESPLRVQRGELVRFYLVNAGPRRSCAFHVIGMQFDTIYPAAPPQDALHGVQTYSVPPGGGAIFELQADTPGTFPFVNHDVGHGDQGAFGLLEVLD